jgi:heme exporter protein C
MSITSKLTAVGRDAATSVIGGPDDDLRISRRPGRLAILTLVALAVFVVAAFLYAPEDELQGAMQRIFYIHVPSAWICFLAFGVVFASSIAYLSTRNEKADAIAAASAEIGTLFTTVVLATGMMWGHAIWGVYWTWEPRLTSFLILWLLYLAYLAVRAYVPDPSRKARYSAVLGIVAFLDVPIVYLSVNWWRTLHPQQVIITSGGPQMPLQMILALLVGLATFTLVYVYLMRLRLQVGRLTSRLEEIES